MIIIIGHYGSGKTNIAINLAVNHKKTYPQSEVYLVDLDVVNPYFRTADNIDKLTNAGIHVIVPNFANTNLDVPSLPAEINVVFRNKEAFAVIDAGGDDAGATVLGRYSDEIDDYELLYVINQCRFMTKTPEEAVEVLRSIERASKLKASGIINNTNLADETDADCVMHSFQFAEQTSDLAGIPLLYTAVRRDLADSVDAGGSKIFPIDMFTKRFF